MRIRLCIIFSLFIIFSSLTINSATVSSADEKSAITGEQIVNDITTRSNGNVTINMSDEITKLLVPTSRQKKKTMRNGAYTTIGYRIQVFSDGRNQHTLESRANARGNAILSRFPKYRGQVYTFSKSPNWYTRVGNFEEIESANEALNELKRAFPSFSGEMRVVRCEVLIRK